MKFFLPLILAGTVFGASEAFGGSLDEVLNRNPKVQTLEQELAKLGYSSATTKEKQQVVSVMNDKALKGKIKKIIKKRKKIETPKPVSSAVGTVGRHAEESTPTADPTMTPEPAPTVAEEAPAVVATTAPAAHPMPPRRPGPGLRRPGPRGPGGPELVKLKQRLAEVGQPGPDPREMTKLRRAPADQKDSTIEEIVQARLDGSYKPMRGPGRPKRPGPPGVPKAPGVPGHGVAVKTGPAKPSYEVVDIVLADKARSMLEAAFDVDKDKFAKGLTSPTKREIYRVANAPAEERVTLVRQVVAERIAGLDENKIQNEIEIVNTKDLSITEKSLMSELNRMLGDNGQSGPTNHEVKRVLDRPNDPFARKKEMQDILASRIRHPLPRGLTETVDRPFDDMSILETALWKKKAYKISETLKGMREFVETNAAVSDAARNRLRGLKRLETELLYLIMYEGKDPPKKKAKAKSGSGGGDLMAELLKKTQARKARIEAGKGEDLDIGGSPAPAASGGGEEDSFLGQLKKATKRRGRGGGTSAADIERQQAERRKRMEEANQGPAWMQELKSRRKRIE